jgi:hypothetical protein
MSMSLILQLHNQAFIGADTAVCATIDNNREQLYRVKNKNQSKLFIAHNKLIFTCGKITDAINIINRYRASQDESIGKLLEIIKDIYKDRDNRLYGYDVIEYNNFKNCIEHNQLVTDMKFKEIFFRKVISDIGMCNINANGYDDKMRSKLKETAVKHARDNMSNPNYGDIFLKSFDAVNCNGVGGYLEMYTLNKQGIFKLPIQKFRDKNIEYIEIDDNTGDGRIIGRLVVRKAMNLDAGATIQWDTQVINKPYIPTLPNYIQSTHIGQTIIESPTIKGNEVFVNAILGLKAPDSSVAGGLGQGTLRFYTDNYNYKQIGWYNLGIYLDSDLRLQDTNNKYYSLYAKTVVAPNGITANQGTSFFKDIFCETIFCQNEPWADKTSVNSEFTNVGNQLTSIYGMIANLQSRVSVLESK